MAATVVRIVLLPFLVVAAQPFIDQGVSSIAVQG
jgi:hypothetical protein